MEWADFIYVGGGNTLRLMTLLRRCGGDRLLDEAYKRGTVLSGVSAGGICWCSCGNSDSRKFTSGSDQLIKVTGLGYLPVLFCPHYDAEPLAPDRSAPDDAPGLWHACHRSGQRRRPGSGGRTVAGCSSPCPVPGGRSASGRMAPGASSSCRQMECSVRWKSCSPGTPTRTSPPDPTYYKRNELTHENSDAHLLCPLFGLLH